jgi:hypothetical protein
VSMPVRAVRGGAGRLGWRFDTGVYVDLYFLVVGPPYSTTDVSIRAFTFVFISPLSSRPTQRPLLEAGGVGAFCRLAARPVIVIPGSSGVLIIVYN